MKNLWILAQAQNEQAQDVIVPEPLDEQGESITKVASDANDGAPMGTGQGGRRLDPMSIFIIVIMVIFVFMMFRGPRKKQAEHRKMVQSLQKNDRVRTIGGIYGTVVDVRDDEIVLKIDESSNTKIRVTPNAIGTKLSEEKS